MTPSRLTLVGRPSKWSAARILVAAIVLPWVVPMPWQGADARVGQIHYLTPQAIEWCTANGGCP